MLSRAHLALLLSGLLAIGATAVGLDVIATRDGDDDAVAWLIGLFAIAFGAALLIGAGVTWQKHSRPAAQASCTVWAGVLLLTACAIGGSANMAGILLAVVAVAMGFVSVWVTG